MGNIGFMELLVILLIILIIFGPAKLPQIGEALGKAIGNFKRAVKKAEEEEDIIKITKSEEEKKEPENDLKG
ncbi:MAG: twin-arginine translocase TatA/TatE family subunit [Candidatus Firestonebacteria bacterium]|nr:twin-arginine translocase TatA/TatE family subunit [Candidatus Firestonebacteria bacterium]